jgi:hypothetical protein
VEKAESYMTKIATGTQRKLNAVKKKNNNLSTTRKNWLKFHCSLISYTLYNEKGKGRLQMYSLIISLDHCSEINTSVSFTDKIVLKNKTEINFIIKYNSKARPPCKREGE